MNVVIADQRNSDYVCDSSDDTLAERDHMAKLVSAVAATHTDKPEKMQGYFKDRIIHKMENNVKV